MKCKYSVSSLGREKVAERQSAALLWLCTRFLPFSHFLKKVSKFSSLFTVSHLRSSLRSKNRWSGFIFNRICLFFFSVDTFDEVIMLFYNQAGLLQFIICWIEKNSNITMRSVQKAAARLLTGLWKHQRPVMYSTASVLKYSSYKCLHGFSPSCLVGASKLWNHLCLQISSSTSLRESKPDLSQH